MRCGNCGHELAPDAKFCQECGLSVDTSCTACGTPLSATAKFCTECGRPRSGDAPRPSAAPPTESPPPAFSAEPRPGPAAAGIAGAERRQLTVMFVDLVGSTELSQRLDNEVLREVLNSYQARSAQVITRYEGYIAQYLGDGMLMYFGYPAAHEDDAERAVRAGI